jgi:hypothetical protein
VLSLEMFERDVQEPLDHFSMGHMGRAEFLKDSRPWPARPTTSRSWISRSRRLGGHRRQRAATDRDGSHQGRTRSARRQSDADKKLFAADRKCPTDDEYFDRFTKAMGGGHSAPGAAATDAAKSIERYYFSQCLKDETMAESIATSYTAAALASPHPVVVHFNGAFHSDYAEGTAARAKRRLPGKRIVVISMRPVKDLDALKPDADELRLGNYVVYTIGK